MGNYEVSANGRGKYCFHKQCVNFVAIMLFTVFFFFKLLILNQNLGLVLLIKRRKCVLYTSKHKEIFFPCEFIFVFGDVVKNVKSREFGKKT